MKILRNLKVPTGNILVVEGNSGSLEMLSLSDYGRDKNVKADFLGLTRELDKVEHTDELLPLEEKWVITISTQYRCNMGCRFCSPESTKVNTPIGEVNINKLKIGDYVIGYDIENKQIQVNQISETFNRKYVGDLICIELENGKILQVTPEHECFLKNGTIKLAKDLTEADELIQF